MTSGTVRVLGTASLKYSSNVSWGRDIMSGICQIFVTASFQIIGTGVNVTMMICPKIQTAKNETKHEQLLIFIV